MYCLKLYRLHNAILPPNFPPDTPSSDHENEGAETSSNSKPNSITNSLTQEKRFERAKIYIEELVESLCFKLVIDMQKGSDENGALVVFTKQIIGEAFSDTLPDLVETIFAMTLGESVLTQNDPPPTPFFKKISANRNGRQKRESENENKVSKKLNQLISKSNATVRTSLQINGKKPLKSNIAALTKRVIYFANDTAPKTSKQSISQSDAKKGNIKRRDVSFAILFFFF